MSIEAMKQWREALRKAMQGNLVFDEAMEIFKKIEQAIAEAEKQEKQKLLPRCFADYQQNHEYDRKCQWCAVRTECQTGEAEKQEPVMGVEVKRIASGGFIGNVWWIHENLQEGVFHLYTHPQPKHEWIGLTERDRAECWYGPNCHEPKSPYDNYAQAIEAKLKELNA